MCKALDVGHRGRGPPGQQARVRVGGGVDPRERAAMSLDLPAESGHYTSVLPFLSPTPDPSGVRPLRRSACAVRLKDDEDYCSSSASSLQGFGAIPHEIQLAMNNRCVCFGCAMILMSVAVLFVHRSWVYLYIGAIFFYRFPLFFPSLPWE